MPAFFRRLLPALLLFVLPGVAVAGAGEASGKTIATATDLVPLGIVSKNLLPDDRSGDAGPLLEKALRYASDHGGGTVSLAKGDYYFERREGVRGHVVMNGLHDVVLEGNGSTFHFGSRNQTGISIWESRGVGVRDLVLDYDRDMPSTSVVVASVDPATGTVHFAKTLGRPVSELDNLNPKKGIRIFVLRRGPDGEMDDLLERYFAAPGFKLEDGKIVLASGRIPAQPERLRKELEKIRPGDVLSISERSRDGVNAIEFSSHRGAQCVGNFARNVTIYSSPAVGLAALWQKEISFSGIKVAPHPDRKDSQFISSNADGINHSAVGKYEVFDSEVSWAGDDGISFSTGDVGKVGSVRGGEGNVVEIAGARYAFYPGEILAFSDAATQKVLGSAAIRSILPREAGLPSDSALLALDRPVDGLAAGAIAFLAPGDKGPAIVIRGNKIRDIYARGIFFSGVRGARIVSNDISFTAGPGILGVASNERTGFRSPGNSDVEIASNTVKNIYSWGLCDNKGGIEIGATNYSGQTGEKLNDAISVVGNTVSAESVGKKHCGIFVSNTADIKVEGNRVEVLRDGVADPALGKDDAVWLR